MPLSDVLGQDHAVRILQRASEAGKLHHGWLISGPGGVGKTLLARELGRLLVCETPGDGPDSCGRCRSCLAVDSGNNPDFLEIAVEGKSKIAVGQIRHLRTLLDYPPHGSRSRAVIFEKAELMSTEAQNALLKTLEEPGDRTFLLLTTAQPSKLLPTVLSRCSRLELAPLSAEILQSILEKKKPELDEATLSLAANLSAGSVTTAASLADQQVEELTARVAEIDDALWRRSIPDLLQLAEATAKDKPRLNTTLELLALWYRDVLRAATIGDDSLAYSQDAELLHRRGELLGVAGATARIEAALRASDALTTRNANSRLTVESMLLRMLS